MIRSLPNYLRSFRQKAHLTQEDIAFLHGLKHGTTITRHEESLRDPSLAAVLRYSAIYSADPRELFAGSFEREVAKVRERAMKLLARLPESPSDAHKLDFLHRLAQTPDVYIVPLPCDPYDAC